MCVVSMVGDYYGDKWQWYQTRPVPDPSVLELLALRQEVKEAKELLKRAAEYDQEHGEPECQKEEKLAVLRKVAELVGIDLEDVLKPTL